MNQINEDSKCIYTIERGDERGLLAVLEEHTSIPFDIKRVFYIYDTKEGIRRGYHAHYKTRQALVCVAGSCKVDLDNLRRQETIVLDKPNKVLLLEPNDWHEMYDFSPGCVLLVLASHHYDPQDYIREYEKFVEVYS
ncbi:sugar 3,4-ketoisomerase [Cohnella hashimotonis]|uniref:FdtA/QdtA family cupin domain-containing protein n=1 Tax=Cohnella hashimotonis TaxID=2826895 RepID=A0ABT6TVF7_9BACL|nr:FdtA/QdtA family cupin domain-containing protein [Cohnella hashimotonis]MDI4650305.1 FdtA/QdtA family cupin domain-containing protein [Cohnella hashimotonis]